jgi:hypothetical protein
MTRGFNERLDPHDRGGRCVADNPTGSLAKVQPESTQIRGTRK